MRRKYSLIPTSVVSAPTTAGSAIHIAYSANPMPNHVATMMLIGLLVTNAPTRFATYSAAK